MRKHSHPKTEAGVSSNFLPPKASELQKKLDANQVQSFYHDAFVSNQVTHFKSLVPQTKILPGHYIVDIGGGCGYFAYALRDELNLPVRVIDTDPVSVNVAIESGVDAVCEDALGVERAGDEGVVCFNLILHHLVSDTEDKTRELQILVLSKWSDGGSLLFVNEYIYESWRGGFSGWLIYQITKSQLLSAVGKVFAAVMPSLRANTFGVGVRFRSNSEWKRLFEEASLTVIGEIKGQDEFVSLPRRLLFIKSIRRDSFLLKTAKP